jgi:hypothetical protein
MQMSESLQNLNFIGWCDVDWVVNVGIHKSNT